MKVLVVSSKFPPLLAPESAHTMFLCQKLAEHETVHLITSSEAATTQVFPFTVHAVMPDWSWRSLPRLITSIRSISPDAILLMYIGWIYNFHPMITFLPTICRAVARKTRFVTQFENVQVANNRWTRCIGRLVRALPGIRGVDGNVGTLLRHSRGLVVMSARHLDQLEKIWPPVTTKTALIPAPPLLRMVEDGDGSVRKRGRATLGVTDGQLLLAYFGYVYRGKGLEFLLRAVQLVQVTVKDVKLVLIGGIAHPDYETELRELACELGIEDRVMWTGHYEPEAEDPSVFLRAADICALPFDAGVRLNNSSFAVAVAHGLATITTAGPDIEPEFEDGVNVWLCPPRDPRALADAINALAGDPALRERLGAGARRLAEQCFSWTRAIDGTLAMLRGEDPRPLGAFGIHRPDPRA